jgi:thioredoxin reductase (NADPH)
MENIYDVIIIGSGPSGLTAGIYTSRGSRKTLLLAGRKWGGQLMLTTEVENFPGFPEPIMGPELMKKMRDQSTRYGTEIVDANVTNVNYSQKPFEVVTDDEKKYYSKSVIIATGADTRWLQIPGEQEHIGRGVSSCAPCDAAFYRNKKVIVVGGGDSAMEEALVLTKFAEHVFVVHRRDSLKASDIMQKKAMENEKISFIFNTSPAEILGEIKVEKVKCTSNLKDGGIPFGGNGQQSIKQVSDLAGTEVSRTDTEVVWEFSVDGVFVAIGHIPNSTIFKGIEKDEKGFIKQHPHSKTNIDGVFVSGDVHDDTYMQAVTAAGYGCQAALDVEKYLEMAE